MPIPLTDTIDLFHSGEVCVAGFVNSNVRSIAEKPCNPRQNPRHFSHIQMLSTLITILPPTPTLYYLHATIEELHSQSLPLQSSNPYSLLSFYPVRIIVIRFTLKPSLSLFFILIPEIFVTTYGPDIHFCFYLVKSIFPMNSACSQTTNLLTKQVKAKEVGFGPGPGPTCFHFSFYPFLPHLSSLSLFHAINCLFGWTESR